MFDEPDHLEPVDWLFHVPGPGEDVDEATHPVFKHWEAHAGCQLVLDQDDMCTGTWHRDFVQLAKKKMKYEIVEDPELGPIQKPVLVYHQLPGTPLSNFCSEDLGGRVATLDELCQVVQARGGRLPWTFVYRAFLQLQEAAKSLQANGIMSTVLVVVGGASAGIKRPLEDILREDAHCVVADVEAVDARKVPADPFTGIMEMAEHGTLMIDRLVSLARMLTDLAPGRHPPWLYVTDEHNEEISSFQNKHGNYFIIDDEDQAHVDQDQLQALGSFLDRCMGEAVLCKSVMYGYASELRMRGRVSELERGSLAVMLMARGYMGSLKEDGTPYDWKEAVSALWGELEKKVKIGFRPW